MENKAAKVKDYMTHNPVILSTEEDINVAFNILTDNKVRQAPVLEDGELVGIVTDRDLRMAIVQHLTDPNINIRSVMTSNPVVIYEDSNLIEATYLISKHRFNALPVLSRKGKLLGILTSKDLIGSLAKQLEETES